MPRLSARILFVFIFFLFSASIASGKTDIVTYQVDGVLTGGPGALYPANNSPNFNDNGTFSLIMSFEESQGTGGTYALTSGVFTINSVYVGSLDIVANTIKVTTGGDDIFELSSVASEAVGVVAAANFTGDEVWHKDGGTDKSTSNTGAAGPDDRYFSLILTDDTGTEFGGSDAIPQDLDQIAWTDLDVRIQWRQSSKISVKGTISSISLIPEPSAAIVLVVLGFVTLSRTGRQRRKRNERSF